MAPRSSRQTPAPMPPSTGSFKVTFAENVTPLSYAATATAAATPAAAAAPSAPASSDCRPDLISPPPTPSEVSPLSPAADCPAPPRSSHARKRDRDHVPRPPNAFILFRAHAIRDGRIPNCLESSHIQLSKILGMYWSGLSPEEKKQWEDAARLAAEAHKLKYPNYKYQPKQRAAADDSDDASDVFSSSSQGKRVASGAVARKRTVSSSTKKNVAADSSRKRAISGSPKKSKAGHGVQMVVEPSSTSESDLDRKAYEIAQLLLSGVGGDELIARLEELNRERQQTPASPEQRPQKRQQQEHAVALQQQQSHFQIAPSHLQHRRSSSAPPTEFSPTLMPPPRVPVACPADGVSRKRVRELEPEYNLQQPFLVPYPAYFQRRRSSSVPPVPYVSDPLTVGSSTGDSSSPAAFDAASVPDTTAIAADLFGAFTRNPFAPAAQGTLPQQELSPLDINFGSFDFGSDGAGSPSPFEMFFPQQQVQDYAAASPVSTDYPSPVDTPSSQLQASFTYDLSSFPTDTIPTSSDLAVWAQPQAAGSSQAAPVQPELWQSQDVQAQPYSVPAVYPSYQPLQQFTQFDLLQSQSQNGYDVPFSPASTAPYGASAPVTPVPDPVMEPEDKVFYGYTKTFEYVSPTPTAPYTFGLPDFLNAHGSEF